jgi:hypothetical protein
LIPEAGKLLVEKSSDKSSLDWKPYDEKGLTPLVPFGFGHYYHVTGFSMINMVFQPVIRHRLKEPWTGFTINLEKYRDEISADQLYRS